MKRLFKLFIITFCLLCASDTLKATGLCNYWCDPYEDFATYPDGFYHGYVVYDSYPYGYAVPYRFSPNRYSDRCYHGRYPFCGRIYCDWRCYPCGCGYCNQ